MADDDELPLVDEDEPPRGNWYQRRGTGTQVLLLVGAIFAGLFAIVAVASGGSDDPSPSVAVPADDGFVDVVFDVTGTARGANLTFDDGNGVQQAANRTVPLSDRNGRPQPAEFRARKGARLYLSAQNTGATGDITCTIKVDGVVRHTRTSSGGYTIATCTTTA